MIIFIQGSNKWIIINQKKCSKITVTWNLGRYRRFRHSHWHYLCSFLTFKRNYSYLLKKVFYLQQKERTTPLLSTFLQKICQLNKQRMKLKRKYHKIDPNLFHLFIFIFSFLFHIFKNLSYLNEVPYGKKKSIIFYLIINIKS